MEDNDIDFIISSNKEEKNSPDAFVTNLLYFYNLIVLDGK